MSAGAARPVREFREGVSPILLARSTTTLPILVRAHEGLCRHSAAKPSRPFTPLHYSTRFTGLNSCVPSCDTLEATRFSLKRIAPHASDLCSVVQGIKPLALGQLLS